MSALVDEIVALASVLADSVDRLPRWLGEAGGVDVPGTSALRERLAEYTARARIAMPPPGRVSDAVARALSESPHASEARHEVADGIMYASDGHAAVAVVCSVHGVAVPCARIESDVRKAFDRVLSSTGDPCAVSTAALIEWAQHAVSVPQRYAQPVLAARCGGVCVDAARVSLFAIDFAVAAGDTSIEVMVDLVLRAVAFRGRGWSSVVMGLDLEPVGPELIADNLTVERGPRGGAA